MKLNFDDDGAAPAKKTAAKKTAVKKTAATKSAPAKKAGKTAANKNTPAKQERQELTTPAATNYSGVHGEIDQDDIILPRLNLVNPSSRLHTEDEIDNGVFVLDKEWELTEKEGTINVVVLDITKRYQQKVDYDSGEMPQVFNTRAEVEENGGTLKWSKEAIDDETYYQNRADIILLLQAPKGTPEEEMHRFGLDHDGEAYTRCVYTIVGGGYNTCAKRIFTNAMGKLANAGGTFTGIWQLSSKKKDNGENIWWTPLSKLLGVVTDPETFAFLQEQSGDDFSTLVREEESD